MSSNNAWFAGKTFLITGGSSGIGLALSKRLASHGAHLVIVSHDPSEFVLARKNLRTYDHQINYQDCDITDAASREILKTSLEAKITDFAGLINCAGVITFGPFFSIPSGVLEHVVRVNLLGTLLMIREIFPTILDNSRGIVYLAFISSTSAILPIPFFGSYPGSKAGLEVLLRSLRQELPSKVKTLVIRPGQVDTALYSKAQTAPGSKVIPLIQNIKWNLLQPDRVAQTMAAAIIAKKSGFMYPNWATHIQTAIMGLPGVGRLAQRASRKYMSQWIVNQE
ncbi:MAG: SDR family NAD(P)-dependent oxidoreductase [Candidatus Heimdallarchaeota archaeon]